MDLPSRHDKHDVEASVNPKPNQKKGVSQKITLANIILFLV